MAPENQFYIHLLCLRHPDIKYTKDLESNFFKKSSLSHITFYLEDDDHKSVDFIGGTISFTCQLFKI